MSDLNSGAIIVLDWGTTNVRAALLADSGMLLDERRGVSGVGKLSPEEFCEHFEKLVADWPEVPAIAAGMVGSRQGWQEADYLPCPASTADLATDLLRFNLVGRPIAIVPGLSLEQDGDFDVMRGEETQLAGLLAERPKFTGTVVLPGTHSKWVAIKDGTITAFRTYMTGDVFKAISTHTILRHSVEGQPDNNHFAAKCKALATSDQSIEGQLFTLRARDLLTDTKAPILRAELSALFITGEIRAAAQDGYPLDGDAILIGDPTLTDLYAQAIAATGSDVEQLVGTDLIFPALLTIAKQADLLDATA